MAVSDELFAVIMKQVQGAYTFGFGEGQKDFSTSRGGQTWFDVERLVADRMRRALEAAEAVWEPTHRHIKSGGFYRVLHKGFMEADLSPVVIYTDIVGHVWVRPAAKFDDGRFEPLPAPLKETE